MSVSAQLHLDNVTFERPDQIILREVSVTVGPGDRVGLTGPNGAGKSTLLEVGAGILQPTSGVARLVPATASVGLLRQEIRAEPDESARTLIERQLGITAAADELELVTAALAEGGEVADRYDLALQRWLDLGGATLDDRLHPTLAELGLDPAKASQPVHTLSGGEQGRVGLATILLAQFDVMLLDEPTNNLDLQGLERLEALLLGSNRPFVVVSHDRRFLERTVSSVIDLDSHFGTVQRFEGGWTAFQEERAIAKAHEQRRFDDFETKKGRLEKRARTEREWATTGVARAKNNMPDNDKILKSFRVESSEKLAGKARRTERAIDRLEVFDKPWEPWRLEFQFGEAGRSGDVVVELAGAVFRRGDFRLGPITLEIRSGERVHIAGPNGAGKTTLVSALFGDEPIIEGTRRIGASVTLGLLDQRRGLGDDCASLLDAVEAATGATLVDCRTTLAKFGLGSAHVARPTSELSPGERTRANLAIFQIRGVNTVVLDEPTNHLDVEAIEQLESALSRFDGTLVVVTHDRAFLDNLRIDREINL